MKATILRRLYFLLSLFSIGNCLIFSQDAKVKNIHPYSENDKVIITYDLFGEEKTEYDIKLFISSLSGKYEKYEAKPNSITGDINKAILSGIDKKIIWTPVELEWLSFEDGDIFFEITANEVHSSAYPTGITPVDTQKTAKAEELLNSGVEVMDNMGNWTDRSTASQIYYELKGIDGEVVTKVIVQKVIRDEDRLRVLFIAVKLGISGSEQQLNDVLQRYGDKSMAEDYLNSGSHSLYEGGKRWANSHGYDIITGIGSHRVEWGQF